MKGMMFDIETVATSSDAAVIAIAAVPFGEAWATVPQPFTSFISPGLAVLYGRSDPKTVEWWNQQDPKVRDLVFGGLEQPQVAFQRLATYVDSYSPTTVWAFPPQFDLTILRYQFDVHGIKTPWHYRDERCARTLKAFGTTLGISYEDCYTRTDKHDPLADCENQVNVVLRTYEAVKLGGRRDRN
jgi:hypothetical protein